MSVLVGAEALGASAGADGEAPGTHADPAAAPGNRGVVPPGWTIELDHTGPVDPQLARRIICDASVARVLMAGPSGPLDVGRRTPVMGVAPVVGAFAPGEPAPQDRLVLSERAPP